MPIQPGTVTAPEFPEGLDWLNTERPLTMRELRGKIVLLDFWTYCCINCMHVLPELERLERKWKDELIVIGVHSAKFLGEKQTENIRQAVLRYEIAHPVVNDHSMQIWQEYAVRAWPSFMLIDPNGKIIGTHSGERVYDLFDGVIAQMVEHFEGEGTLDRTPVSFALERARQPESVLSFPGKVLADDAGDRLFIADTNHNRIVIASLSTGHVLDIVGSGEAGFADGSFAETKLDHPQGMAVEGDLLYIADTDNHAIRRADLRARQVVTLAGDGEQAEDFDNRPGPARGRRLNSPWDLDLAHGVLFIAMAGQHQVWGLDLEEFYIAGHAGSGQEDHVDGPLLAASLAQPSGLTHDDSTLFVADSEVSSIRAVDLDPRGGHAPWSARAVRLWRHRRRPERGPALQHPLDVEYGGPVRRRHLQQQDQDDRAAYAQCADILRQRPGWWTVRLKRRASMSRAGCRRRGQALRRGYEQPRDSGGGHRERRGGDVRALQDARSWRGATDNVEHLPVGPQVRSGKFPPHHLCFAERDAILTRPRRHTSRFSKEETCKYWRLKGDRDREGEQRCLPVRIETSIYYCEEKQASVCTRWKMALSLEEAEAPPRLCVGLMLRDPHLSHVRTLAHAPRIKLLQLRYLRVRDIHDVRVRDSPSVVLVITLGGVELVQGHDLGDDRLTPAASSCLM
ncbi:MAG: thioredoxin-like domain-containing protein [Bryobacterales bacterium]